jgi:hypothetical protein
MMDFPINELMDERACYDWLVGLLHPGGLVCPGCGGADTFVHRFVRDPVLDFPLQGVWQGVTTPSPAPTGRGPTSDPARSC